MPKENPKDKVSYIIRDIPRAAWTEFQVHAKRSGMSAAEMLRRFIMAVADAAKRE